MKLIKIFLLKRKVKKLYLKVRRIEDNNYSVGNDMLKYLVVEYHPLCVQLDSALAALNKLDPKCPPARNVNK